jgi:uncharacterized protein YuzB (UPF0349 family)
MTERNYPYVGKNPNSESYYYFTSPDIGVCIKSKYKKAGKRNSNIAEGNFEVVAELPKGYLFAGIGDRDNQLFTKSIYAYSFSFVSNRLTDNSYSGDTPQYAYFVPPTTNYFFIKNGPLLVGESLKENNPEDTNYGSFICDTDDPILWECFVKLVEDYTGKKIYNSHKIGMGEWIYIGENNIGGLSRSITRNHFSKTLEVKSLADLDKIRGKKQVVKPQLPEINGYKGTYDKEMETVEYGCAKIRKSQIESMYYLVNGDTLSNRTVEAFTLDSGVVLTKENVIDIYEVIVQE